MERYTLKNGIKTIIKKNNNTPRTAVVLFSKLNKDEEKAGLYYLLTQMLFQGTKSRTSEELANELDENAIELNVEKKADYIRFKLLCLNEDINQALEIMQDIIENSTFNDFEKEIEKIKGEFEADLDSAKVKAQDEYYRTIFPNHAYGVGRNEILKAIGSITKEDLMSVYDDIKYSMQKNIVVVGDIDKEVIIPLLENHLGDLKVSDEQSERKELEPLTENVVSIVEKEDANQAQIFQGWRVPSVLSEDYPVLSLINTIMGASGLSSRLFLELREKQGLAYTVRSVNEPMGLGGHFFVYIGTEPKNIQVSINGFKKEMEKIMTEPVSDEELENAKNNAIGKRQFYYQTNLIEALTIGYYEFSGLGYDFEEKLINAIKLTTKEQIMAVASKYLSNNNALCVLAPKKYLEEANLIK
ncbi:MAG: insulinase family protein [Candidatus Gastranaerophilales bacterium]|nr:insulinase family protein [Candidatus Gastranaerophilales bacterium]